MRPTLLVAVLITLVTHPARPQSTSLSPQVSRFVSVPGPVVALTNARVIDGNGAPGVDNRTILIRDGRIAGIGATGSVTIPGDAEVRDLSGKSVFPGFVMLHEHFFYPAGQGAYNQLEYSFPRLYLAGGATTIRTGGSRDPYGDLNLKKAVDEGTVPGPNIHVTGPYLNGPGLPIFFVNTLDGPDDARTMVNFWADQGATSFKAYMHIDRDELAAAVAEAHRRDLDVTGHLCSVTYREAAEHGIDNLEHGFFASTDFVENKRADECPPTADRTQSLMDLHVDGPEATELINYLVERGVAVTSTLTVFETSVPNRPPASSGALNAMSPQARDQYLRRWSAVSQNQNSPWTTLFEKGMKLERRFAEAGGLLVAGTDPTGYGGVVAGYANQRAIELLVEAGFTPEEAIEIGTRNGAIFLGVDNEVGTVEVGKVADLVVVRGDPTTNIQDIRNVEIVFKDGIGYDSRKLISSAEGWVGIR